MTEKNILDCISTKTKSTKINSELNNIFKDLTILSSQDLSLENLSVIGIGDLSSSVYYGNGLSADGLSEPKTNMQYLLVKDKETKEYFCIVIPPVENKENLFYKVFDNNLCFKRMPNNTVGRNTQIYKNVAGDEIEIEPKFFSIAYPITSAISSSVLDKLKHNINKEKSR